VTYKFLIISLIPLSSKALQHAFQFMKCYSCYLILVSLFLNHAMVNQNVIVLTWKYGSPISHQNFQEERTRYFKCEASLTGWQLTQ